MNRKCYCLNYPQVVLSIAVILSSHYIEKVGDSMRRIDLKKEAQFEYEVIKELVDHNGNKNRAAMKLGCSLRTINRHIVGYQNEGKAYFIHGNTGRKPISALPEERRHLIVDLYNNKYYGASFAHFRDLLESEENIVVSETTVRNILKKNDTLSPLANRKTRRRFKAKLETSLKNAKTQKEADRIKSRIADAEDAHPRRPRCSRFGEMIQMDASEIVWFGNEKYTLHVAVDDATGIVVGAWFDRQETLNGYYNVLKQILEDYGIPYMFYTDRRTVFEYRKGGSTDEMKDTFTQFGYACKQLGVEIKTTSVAQAKGRVERLNGTLQRRLPVELRLKGVCTVEQANECLPGLIAKHNAKFALSPKSFPSVFEDKPSANKINMVLAVVAERTVDCGHSVKIDSKYFKTVKKDGSQVCLVKGTKGLVVKTFFGDMFYTVDDNVFALEEIDQHERTSRNFDTAPVEKKPSVRHIPAANHPWRLSSFKAFAKKNGVKDDVNEALPA